jgi:hypothetical protein
MAAEGGRLKISSPHTQLDDHPSFFHSFVFFPTNLFAVFISTICFLSSCAGCIALFLSSSFSRLSISSRRPTVQTPQRDSQDSGNLTLHNTFPSSFHTLRSAQITSDHVCVFHVNNGLTIMCPLCIMYDQSSGIHERDC